jgi:hypothetical protein
MKPTDYNHPDDYAKAFTAAHPGFFPTYFSSFVCAWEITKETEKAVLVDYQNWLPKSQILIESGRVIGVKRAFYAKLQRTAARYMGS